MRFPEFTDEWVESRLEEIATIVGGGTPSSINASFWQGSIPWISSSDLLPDDISNINVSRYITEEAVFKSATKLIAKDSILVVSRVGVGKVAITKTKICTSQDFTNLTNIDGNILYIAYLLQSIMKQKIKETQGTSIKGITSSEIKDIKINLPSIDEQTKIATLLSLIDQRIETQNKIIEDLKLLKNSLCAILLHNKNWEKQKIGDISKLGRGRVISTTEINTQKRPKYPVYSSQTSNNGIMGYLDSYDFEGECLTWTTDGANAGTVFYRNGKFNCTNVCGTIQLKANYDAYFLCHQLQRSTQKFVSSNLANPKLMNNTMANIQISVPLYDIQVKFGYVFKLFDDKIILENIIIDNYKKQKKHLLNNLFI